jgi:hypothetical protein
LDQRAIRLKGTVEGQGAGVHRNAGCVGGEVSCDAMGGSARWLRREWCLWRVPNDAKK